MFSFNRTLETPHSFENNLSLSQLAYTLLLSLLPTSTCPELSVSSLILGFQSNEMRILSVGVNGTPDEMSTVPLYLHKRHCIHAEEQAVKRLPLNFLEYVLVSYSSMAPCYRCAYRLFNIGISAHVYIAEYDDPTGITYLLNKGIPVYKLDLNHLAPVHTDLRLFPIWLRKGESA